MLWQGQGVEDQSLRGACLRVFVRERRPGQIDEKNIKNQLPKVSKTSGPLAVAAVRPDALCAAPLEYDVAGKVVGVHRMLITNKGFSEDGLVKNTGDGDDIMKIVKIKDNGDVMVKKFTFKGTLDDESETVPSNELYKYVLYKYDPPTNADYPAKGVLNENKLELEMCSNSLSICERFYSTD